MKRDKGEIKGELLLILLIAAIIGFVTWFIITKKPLPFQKAKVVPNNTMAQDIDKPEDQVQPDTSPTNNSMSAVDKIRNSNESTNSSFEIESTIGGMMAYADDGAKYRVLSRERYFTIELTQKGKIYITMSKEQEDLLEEYGLITSKSQVGLKLGEKNELTGTTGKVVDFKFGRFGDSTKDSALLILLEDGSVEYTEFNNLIGNCTSEGKLKDLKEIVKIQSVVRVYDNKEDSDSIVAIDKDNNIYDVGAMLGY